MKRVYLKQVIRTEPSTPTHYTYDDKVDPGRVLVIRGMTVHWHNFKTSEAGQFFIEDGGQNIFIGEDTPDRTHGHAYWSGTVAIGEGDRPAVYTPESEASDLISFSIYGELLDLDDWRKAN